jgi:hypothetical protein
MDFKLNKTEESWIEVLAKDKKYNNEDFMDNYLDLRKGETTLSIFRYRNNLIMQQTDADNIVKIDTIISVLNGKDTCSIKEAFEEMFLEPFSKCDVDIIIQFIKNIDTLNWVLEQHNINKIERLMSILTRITRGGFTNANINC